MNNQEKFSQIFQKDNSKFSVVSFEGITLKISTLLEFANTIFHNQALEIIDEGLREYGIGSLSIIMQSKERKRQNKDNWNIEGMDAEILEPNTKAWKKGKIRMRVVLEFCPEESEEEQTETISNKSPLDDIRQTMKE